MEPEETPPAELPALTDPSKIADLVSRLYHQLPGSIADSVAMTYAETLIRVAAGRMAWNELGGVNASLDL